MNKIKVALVGYGSQGRRIAEAVSVQPDIQLVGVCLREPDGSAHMAFRKGFPIYAMSNGDVDKFKNAQIDLQGSLHDILFMLDVVVDATPSGVGKKNKEILHSRHGLKAIFQAGEEFDVADVPVFISRLKYEEAKKVNFVRIPTPQTVSLLRTIEPLESKFGIHNVNVTFVMPSAEPMHGQTGVVDTIIPDQPALLQILKDEIGSVMPKKTVLSSFKIPSILLGVESITVQLNTNASRDDIINSLKEIPRTILVRGNKGLHSTDSIFEYIRRIGRPSADIYEACIWYEQIEITDNTIKLVQAFDSHCVQTPEVMDAIRALVGKEEMQESFDLTNKALKLLNPGIYP